METILRKIESLKNRMSLQVAMKGCVKMYPDKLKEEALVLMTEGKLSLNKLSELLDISPFTLRKWRHFFEVEKPNSSNLKNNKIKEDSSTKNVKPKIESFIKISNAETRESMLAKKILRNKARYEKTKEEIEKEVPEDIKVYLTRAIDAAIPIVNTRGDVIPEKFRNMQEDWMTKNKVKKYSGGGNLLEE